MRDELHEGAQSGSGDRVPSPHPLARLACSQWPTHSLPLLLSFPSPLFAPFSESAPRVLIVYDLTLCAAPLRSARAARAALTHSCIIHV